MEDFSRFDIFSLIILLGVFQGFFISLFLLTGKYRYHRKNIFLALLTFVVSLASLEILLNYTGLITNVIYLNDFSESFTFTIGPLFFLYIFHSLYPNQQIKLWPHFIWFVFYSLYLVFYFIQSNELKYNSFLECYHPEAEMLPVTIKIDDDPLGIRTVVNQLVLFHFIGYATASAHFLLKEYKNRQVRFWSLKGSVLHAYRWFVLHFCIIILVFVFVKINFDRDLGDYFIASYIAFWLYLTSYAIINRSGFFMGTVIESKSKYEKSSLDDEWKMNILQKLEVIMRDEQYYKSNLASLSDIAAKVNESSHNVSQVINEKAGMNFYNWLATYRVQEAKNILSGNDRMKYKIEEIAEIVGYNSKASFNKAFKSFTGQTPSEFRKEVQ